MVLGLVCLIGLPTLSFAQDPGIQDSMIFGNLNRTPILAGLNMQIIVPVYLRTDDSVTFVHIPMATDNNYVAHRDSGTILTPLSLWDDRSFLAPDPNSPRVGFTSQSILGFAYLADPYDPQNFLYTHGQWLHIADFKLTTTDNIAVLGDTTFFSMGRNPANDSLALGLSDGATEVHPAIVWGSIYFPPNTPPAFVGPAPGTYQVNEQFGANFIVTATDPDTDSMVLTVDFGPTNYTFTEIQDIPGTISYRFNWVPDVGSSGTYPLTFVVNDGNGGVIPLQLTLVVTPTGLSIASMNAMPGGTISIPVNLDNQGSSSAVGGFSILINWNPEALSLNGITRAGRTGSFEYFHITRDDGGPGSVRIVGLADIRNGVVSPPMHPGNGPIFMLEMSVAPDEALIGVDLPVTFLNLEPADNTLSDSTGYLLVHPDLTNSIISVVGPEQFLTGDINLNGIPYEVADVVLFVNHLTNPTLFPFDAVQRAASDVNADGLTETVADLVYLINIVNHVIPRPRLEPGMPNMTLLLASNAGNTSFIADSPVDLGAVLVRIPHEPGVSLIPSANGRFTIASNDDGYVLSVLAYLPESGTGNVGRVPL
ncbi:MAG TPA: hypothetical protein DCZ43_11900, partial [candidate division Zixibacteria bacterium]|nr:hypothetical protein [candidate division Zixibacteria bacterium]